MPASPGAGVQGFSLGWTGPRLKTVDCRKWPLPATIIKADGYGGGIEGRNRFAIEVVQAVATAIGADRVGIRLSPYGVLNGTGAFADVEDQYFALCRALSPLGLLYLHIPDHAAMGTPPVPGELKLE